MTRGSLSVEIAGRKISKTFYDWLAAEVKSSGVDNTYLDNFSVARKRLGEDYYSNQNWAAEKQESHLNRLNKIWWPEYKQDPEDDKLSAQILFGALIFISGAYRIQSYLQSKTPEEYADRRRRAIGINLGRTVSDHLATILPSSGNFSHANLSVDSYDGPSLEASKDHVICNIGEKTVKNVVKRVGLGLDLGEEHSPSVIEMLHAQTCWIEFATDCVAVAAKLRRGDLASVPFLEPKSISAKPGPKVIYPLAA